MYEMPFLTTEPRGVKVLYLSTPKMRELIQSLTPGTYFETKASTEIGKDCKLEKES